VTFKSPHRDVDIPDIALTPFVLQHGERLRDKTAIVDAGTGRSYSYGEIARHVRQFAASLNRRGFRKGDVLAILSPNLPEYPIAFHGVASAGGVNTTLNPVYTADEIAYQLNDSRAKLLLTVPAQIEKAREAAARSKVEEIIVFGEAPGAVPFESLLDTPDEIDVAIDPLRDLVALPYSSGTTGFSKGVMLTHRNLVANLVQIAACLQVDEDERLVAFLPFFHIYGMTVIMNLGLLRGTTLVTMQRFELEPFLKAVQDHRATRIFLVPPVVLLLAKSPLVDAYDLSSVTRAKSGAAPLDAELAAAVTRRLGFRLAQGYGLTETSPVTHIVPDSVEKPVAGSVGSLVPNTECKIVDVATGRELGRNEDGELWMRGPQIMKGYLDNPEATRNAIDPEGFFHSGDIGHVDDNDQFFIVDRLKELIKYKGYQVAPAELEALLLSHPKIADAAVIGVRDGEGEEIPKAFVVRREPLTDVEVMDFVAARVAPYKKVRRVEFVEQVPKSPTGKILRRLLRARETSEHG
jgi:acyl-CoA synthetase (AMP-forming)/AMP-acid ligase II